MWCGVFSPTPPHPHNTTAPSIFYVLVVSLASGYVDGFKAAWFSGRIKGYWILNTTPQNSTIYWSWSVPWLCLEVGVRSSSIFLQHMDLPHHHQYTTLVTPTTCCEMWRKKRSGNQTDTLNFEWIKRKSRNCTAVRIWKCHTVIHKLWDLHKTCYCRSTFQTLPILFKRWP